jgi:hypothetical protein
MHDTCRFEMHRFHYTTYAFNKTLHMKEEKMKRWLPFWKRSGGNRIGGTGSVGHGQLLRALRWLC